MLKASLTKQLHGYRFELTPERGDKARRAQPLAAQAQAGNVRIVRGPWNKGFIDQLCIFPNGRLKDQADAASRAYSNLVRRRTAGVSTFGRG